MTTSGQSRSPEPEELLRLAVEYFLSDTHTAMPGRIEEYSPDEQRADVQPLLKRRIAGEDGTELVEDLPIIPDVPICFPRTSKFFLTFPIEKGDLVLLVFAERSLDTWLSGSGEAADPNEFRMHDLTDAVALPGLFPFTAPVKDIDSKAMALGRDNGGMQIHIKEDRVEVTEGSATIVHPAIAEKLENLWKQLKLALDRFDNHIHTTTATVGPTAVPGVISPPTIKAQAPSWDSSIQSGKIGFPDG